MVTATGMGAVTLVLALLEPGDRLVVPHDCYGGCWRLFDALARKHHFELVIADLTDPAQLAAALAARAGDGLDRDAEQPAAAHHRHRAVASAAHAAGALVVVDNTFLSPALQQPIALGADVVVHSTTKYINGHSDVVGGAVVARDAAVARAAHLVGQRARPDREPVRQLPHAARPAHARRPPAGAPRERRGDRGDAGRAPGRPRGALARAARPPGPRAGRAPAARVRRDAERGAGRRRGGRRGIRQRVAALHAGRVARRGGEPGRASRRR